MERLCDTCVKDYIGGICDADSHEVEFDRDQRTVTKCPKYK